MTSNTVVSGRLSDLYGDVGNIDLWVGGLAEDHVFGSELGGTFHALMVDQVCVCVFVCVPLSLFIIF